MGFEGFDIYDETKRKLQSEGWTVRLVERMQPPGCLVIAKHEKKGRPVQGAGETPARAMMQVWAILHPHDADF